MIPQSHNRRLSISKLSPIASHSIMIKYKFYSKNFRSRYLRGYLYTIYKIKN